MCSTAVWAPLLTVVRPSTAAVEGATDGFGGLGGSPKTGGNDPSGILMLPYFMRPAILVFI